MHIIRVIYETGVEVHLLFNDEKAAARAKSDLDVALPKGGTHLTSDQCGHSFTLRLDKAVAIVQADAIEDARSRLALQGIVAGESIPRAPQTSTREAAPRPRFEM